MTSLQIHPSQKQLHHGVLVIVYDQVSRRKEDDLSIISAGFAVSLDDDLKGL